MKSTFFVLALLSFTLSQGVNAQARIGTGPVKNLYEENCAACHGKDMHGGASVSLLDEHWIHGNDDESITNIITNGVEGTSMQGFGDVLTSEQIRSLVVLITEYKAMDGSKKSNHSGGITNSSKKAGHEFTLEYLVDAPGILWGMDFLPDGSMLITQKDGKLWHATIDSKDSKSLTEITGIPDVWHHRQGGLLDIQIHPEYDKHPWIYLVYAENLGAGNFIRGKGMTAIARGKIIDGKWQQNEFVFRFPEALHVASGSHFGSRIVFKDGHLYFGVGDRGDMDSAQDLSVPNGKIHRITLDGKVPKDNPFVNQKDALPSIWSYGNRNPQGLAFHPVTGELWQTEHGPRGGDELNVIHPGHNYGWPLPKGSPHLKPIGHLLSPLQAWTFTQEINSPTGKITCL
jgi:glucose/arabinose dehydrogenase